MRTCLCQVWTLSQEEGSWKVASHHMERYRVMQTLPAATNLKANPPVFADLDALESKARIVSLPSLG